MLNKRRFLTDRKRGFSAIVTTLILVVLTFVLVSIMWVVVKNIVSDNLGKAESCFGTFEKVTLNNEYTCYNKTSSEFLFSINIKDIEVEGVLFSITWGVNGSRSYIITNDDQTIVGLSTYPSLSGPVKLPVQNAGKTYVSTGTLKPSSIEIAPIINGQQCDVADSSFEIGLC